jgi:hypothetical protein
MTRISTDTARALWRRWSQLSPHFIFGIGESPVDRGDYGATVNWRFIGFLVSNAAVADVSGWP